MLLAFRDFCKRTFIIEGLVIMILNYLMCCMKVIFYVVFLCWKGSWMLCIVNWMLKI